LVQIGNKTKENDTEKILALKLKLPLFVLQFEQNKFMLRSINKSASKHSIRGENKMKKLGIISMLLILILSGCIGDKYSATALKLEEQQIKIDITDIAHENAEEIMKQKGYDDLLVMIKGSC